MQEYANFRFHLGRGTLPVLSTDAYEHFGFRRTIPNIIALPPCYVLVDSLDDLIEFSYGNFQEHYSSDSYQLSSRADVLAPTHAVCRMINARMLNAIAIPPAAETDAHFAYSTDTLAEGYDTDQFPVDVLNGVLISNFPDHALLHC